MVTGLCLVKIRGALTFSLVGLTSSAMSSSSSAASSTPAFVESAYRLLTGAHLSCSGFLTAMSFVFNSRNICFCNVETMKESVVRKPLARLASKIRRGSLLNWCVVISLRHCSTMTIWFLVVIAHAEYMIIGDVEDLARGPVTYLSKPFESHPACRELDKHLKIKCDGEYPRPNHVRHFWSVENNT